MQLSPDSQKLLGFLAIGILSSPVLIAAFKAIFFFGQASKAIERISDIDKKIDDFILSLQETLQDHHNRILVIETERRIEMRTGRRATDPIAQVPSAVITELNDAESHT